MTICIAAICDSGQRIVVAEQPRVGGSESGDHAARQRRDVDQRVARKAAAARAEREVRLAAMSDAAGPRRP